MSEVLEIGKRARTAAAGLASCSTATKDAALRAMAASLDANVARILDANATDLERAHDEGIAGALIDRLTLTPERITEMAEALRHVTTLKDPIGEMLDGWTRPNGLRIAKVRVPLGVVGIIYEADRKSVV